MIVSKICIFFLNFLPFIAIGKKNLLSFGGNGMIGSAVLNQLIKKDIYNITIVDLWKQFVFTKTTF